MADIEHDEDGLPTLTVHLPFIIKPASQHDKIALAAALNRLSSAPHDSPEALAIADEIRAIEERGRAAQG